MHNSSHQLKRLLHHYKAGLTIVLVCTTLTLLLGVLTLTSEENVIKRVRSIADQKPLFDYAAMSLRNLTCNNSSRHYSSTNHSNLKNNLKNYKLNSQTYLHSCFTPIYNNHKKERIFL